MNALRDTAAAWLAAGRTGIMVEIAHAEGSVPREAGTRMLVAEDACAGTIGGGHLEWEAVAEARALLRHGLASAYERRVALGPSLGQCCGGAVLLRYVRLDAAVVAGWPAAMPRFMLQLYGAGHVGHAIARLLAGLDVQVQWIDGREEAFADAPRASNIARVCVDALEAEVALAPPGAYYLVLTHDHDLDWRITEAILKRGDFGYLGLIGSRTKRAKFERRYRARGIADATLARMTCPIGVPGITGKAPEVIAIAVAAQLLAVSSAAPAAALAATEPGCSAA
jgi:xanthine dehydrogenase accessory factor